MAKSLYKLREKLFQLEDEYMDKVDVMTEKIQESMENHISSHLLFGFRWTIE